MILPDVDVLIHAFRRDRSTKIVGPKVTDAWFAALAIEWGCDWVTFDRDFARFPGLRWSTPL